MPLRIPADNTFVVQHIGLAKQHNSSKLSVRNCCLAVSHRLFATSSLRSLLPTSPGEIQQRPDSASSSVLRKLPASLPVKSVRPTSSEPDLKSRLLQTGAGSALHLQVCSYWASFSAAQVQACTLPKKSHRKSSGVLLTAIRKHSIALLLDQLCPRKDGSAPVFPRTMPPH